MIGLGLDGYDPDSGHESAIAFRIQVVEDSSSSRAISTAKAS
jgi:hypothetical protein